MLARIHRSMKEKDEGFTLIELLVVMIIIGILAAIAIPVFLSQRAKAKDSATKSDVSTVGKEIASYYVDNTTQVTVATSGTSPNLTADLYAGASATGTPFTSVKLSSGTTLSNQSGTNASNWCVALTNADGSSTKTWKYSATGGLQASSSGC